MIASYEYYAEQFGGVKIPAESFYQLEKEAERYLDRVTKRRIRKQGAVTDEVRQAACAVAEIFYQRDRREPGAKSEELDGYAVSYADTAEDAAEKLAWRAVQGCLDGSGLLFCGVLR